MWRLHNNRFPFTRQRWVMVLLVVLSLLILAARGLPGQTPESGPPYEAPSSQEPSGGDAPLFRTQVDLVALHVAVFDSLQHLVTGLPREAFEVLDDGKPQRITEFSNRDIPVSMGILVDSSASMTDKRPSVNAAALALVRASNPADEVFILNFRDSSELTQDYTSDIAELERGLSEVRMWGGTAVMDAVRNALDHSQRGTQAKKVLLVITDGEDDASKTKLPQLVALLQKSEATVYAIGILSQEPSRNRKNAEKMLQSIAQVSGGAAYFPRSMEEVEALATRIAHDIRNQYVLAYPVPPGAKPGFHSVRVRLRSGNLGKLTVRTRPGYFYDPASRSAVRP